MPVVSDQSKRTFQIHTQVRASCLITARTRAEQMHRRYDPTVAEQMPDELVELARKLRAERD